VARPVTIKEPPDSVLSLYLKQNFTFADREACAMKPYERERAVRSLARGLFMIVVAFLGSAGLMGLAHSADRHAPGSATITVKAIGRDGQPAVVGEDAVAVPLFNARQAQYRSDSAGVLTVPPGKYLLTADITSSETPTKLTGTLAARIVTVRNHETVIFDARKGKPLVLHLNQPGAKSAVAAAGLCYGTGPMARSLVSDDEPFESGSTAIYAIPFKYTNMSFGYAAN